MRGTQAWTNSSYHINHSNKVVHLKWGVKRSLILPRSSCFKTKNAIYSPPLQMCGQWPCTYPRRKYPPAPKKHLLPGTLEHREAPAAAAPFQREAHHWSIQSCHFHFATHVGNHCILSPSGASWYRRERGECSLSPKATKRASCPPGSLGGPPAPPLCFPKQIWGMSLASMLSDPA